LVIRAALAQQALKTFNISLMLAAERAFEARETDTFNQRSTPLRGTSG
jgi:hypothetical protein